MADGDVGHKDVRRHMLIVLVESGNTQLIIVCHACNSLNTTEQFFG